jgi:hypothetical protein
VKRPCGDCSQPTNNTRCAACTRTHNQQREHQRGNATARGYGTTHRHARQQMAATLPAPCGYCGHTIWPDQRWDLAHVIDGDPTAGYIAAHPICNQRAKRSNR